MKTRLVRKTIAELTENVISVDENGKVEPFKTAANECDFGVFALNGTLECRPSYQREYIWTEDEQKEFIYSLLKGWTIAPIFVSVNEKDAEGNPIKMEIVDGQQRILTICRFIADKFNILHNGEIVTYSNFLDGNQTKESLKNYEILIIENEYEDYNEKIEHFKAINKKTTVLTAQEIRNAAFNGTFVEALKQKFGRKRCEVDERKKDYRTYISKKVRTDRQELVELAISWYLVQVDDELYEKLSKYENHPFDEIKDMDSRIGNFMKEHMYDENCEAIWDNYLCIVKWLRNTFNSFTNSPMQNVKNWAFLYRKYKDVKFDANMLEELKGLMVDPDIHHKHSIPEYLMIKYVENLGEKELDRLYVKLLSVDHFPQKVRETAFMNQNFTCCDCGKQFDSTEISKMHAHHIRPRSMGGRNDLENCVMLCPDCHGARHNMRIY